MTRKEAFEKVIEADSVVNRAQTLEALELLANGVEPLRVVEAVLTLRHGLDMLYQLDCELQQSRYEAEYEAEFGCKPELRRGSRRY